MTITDIVDEVDRTDWSDLIDAQAGSLAPVWDDAEDDVWNNA
jgi:hypothetical protein